MSATRRRRLACLAVVAALGLVAASCGDDDGGNGSSATTAASGGATTAASGGATTTGGADTTTIEKTKVNLTMGASQSSSSVFAFLSAHARLAAEADGAMDIQVRETNASSENIQLVNDKAVEFGISSWELSYQAQQGIGAYEGKALPDIMNIMNYLLNAEVLLVRDDAGIETIYDLDGKAFAPSFQGSSVYNKFATIFDFLGIEIETFTGSLEDVTNAVKDGRIVGFGKSANGLTPDASMLDAHSAVKMKPLGFSQEDIDKLAAEFPYYKFTEIPAGFLGYGESFQTTAIYSDYIVNASMDEDVAYRLTKALWETIEQAAGQTNYVGAEGRTPEETVETMELMELHPGAIRYYEEIGAI